MFRRRTAATGTRCSSHHSPSLKGSKRQAREATCSRAATFTPGPGVALLAAARWLKEWQPRCGRPARSVGFGGSRGGRGGRRGRRHVPTRVPGRPLPPRPVQRRRRCAQLLKRRPRKESSRRRAARAGRRLGAQRFSDRRNRDADPETTHTTPEQPAPSALACKGVWRFCRSTSIRRIATIVTAAAHISPTGRASPRSGRRAQRARHRGPGSSFAPA